MEPEFVQLFISNMPNFVGLVLLAYVLWRVVLQWRQDSEACQARFDALLNRVLAYLEEME